MRRVMLLALLALAFPTAALAGSFTHFHWDVVFGSVSTPPFTNPFDLFLHGHPFSEDFLRLKTSSISPDSCPKFGKCTFSSGSMLFQNFTVTFTLFDGEIIRQVGGEEDNIIRARFRGNRVARFGGTVDILFRFTPDGHIFGGDTLSLSQSTSHQNQFRNPAHSKGFCLEPACSVSLS